MYAIYIRVASRIWILKSRSFKVFQGYILLIFKVNRREKSLKFAQVFREKKLDDKNITHISRL